MSRLAYTNEVRLESGTMCLGLLFFFGIEHQVVRVDLDEFVELMTFFYGIHLMEVRKKILVKNHNMSDFLSALSLTWSFYIFGPSGDRARGVHGNVGCSLESRISTLMKLKKRLELPGMSSVRQEC